MPVFSASKMRMFSAEGEWDVPCEVRIDDGLIAISYEDDGEFVVYAGREEQSGHFRLTSEGVSGRATLHRFAGDDVLEGWWLEDRTEGMWRIYLE